MRPFFIFFLISFSLTPLSAKIVERVLAVVEGEMVLMSDVEAFKKRLHQNTLINENLLTLLKLSSSEKNNAKILDYLISKKIILGFAKKDLNLLDSEELAAKEISQLAKQNNITTKQLKEAILARGIDFNNYKAFIVESSLIRSALEKNVISKVRPSEEDFVSYLRIHGIGNIKNTKVYNLNQIFIPKKSSVYETSKKNLTPSNFNLYFENPNKYGVDILSLGNLDSNDLSKENLKVLTHLEEGDVSAPIETPSGIRFFFIKSLSQSYAIPNTAQIQKLQREFYESRIAEQFHAWFNSLKSTFFVRKNAA